MQKNQSQNNYEYLIKFYVPLEDASKQKINHEVVVKSLKSLLEMQLSTLESKDVPSKILTSHQMQMRFNKVGTVKFLYNKEGAIVKVMRSK